MKKDIGFVGLDSSLVKWLYEKLRSSVPETVGAKELLEGVENLMNGKVTTLLLELGADEAILPPKDTILCGALTIYPKLRKVTRDDEEVILLTSTNIVKLLRSCVRHKNRFLILSCRLRKAIISKRRSF